MGEIVKMKQKTVKGFVAKLLAAACAFTMCVSATSLDAQAAEATLLNTYGATYGNSGTCINLSQLRDSSQLSFLKKHYNSITLENEMKPDSLLGSGRTMSVSQAKSQGYYIPSNYTESTVPVINFNTVDEVMKICNQNGLRMRAHTLVWHSQTPDWFFKSNYNNGAGYVGKQQMNARLEMYVKTVINHVYNNPNGKVVYAWDVANEVIHSNGNGWEKVYGPNKTDAEYVKNAFNYAYDALSQFKLQNSVKLFYNDYNEYDVVREIETLVKNINKQRKVCGGVGMQSHVGNRGGMYPGTDKYVNALKSFSNLGVEVQITELDVKADNDSVLNSYTGELFDKINAAKKAGANVTGITWWGLSDQTTWLANQGYKPLLFSRPGQAKPVYNTVINSYIKCFGQPGSTQPNPTPVDPQPSEPGTGTGTGTGTQTPENPNSTAKIDNGWYYIKNVLSNKYLTVNNNTAKAVTNVNIAAGTGAKGQKWYVENKSNGYITLKSALGDFSLDVANGSDESGANIQIYDTHGLNAQQFIVKNTKTKNVYTIGTKCSDAKQYLDVYEKKTADGTNVCQWAYNGNTNQQWIFEKADGSSQQTPGKTEEDKPSNPTPTPTPEPEQEEPVAEASGLTVSSSINSWGSGYVVNLKVKNDTKQAVNGWTLKVKKSEVKIDNSWNMTVKTSGDYYVITPVEWNKTVYPGQSVDIGFQGAGGIGSSINVEIQ